MTKIIIIAIIQCFLLASGQVCFKLAIEKTDKLQWTWACFTDLLTNWWLLASGICVILATVLWGFMLKHLEFSIAHPITALAYVFGMLAAVFVFQETVSITRWIGVGLIILGVIFIVK
jgi:Membrane transporters of cations and cationic drugs